MESNNGCMTYYLADIENIAHKWHEFTSLANPGDLFLLFYSKFVGPVRMSLFGPASVRGIEFKFIECRIGPNAMDFQIATELGRLAALHPDDKFVVLSNDTGFDVVIKYWKDRGINISRQAPAHNGQHPRVNTPHEAVRADGGVPASSAPSNSESAPALEESPSGQAPAPGPEDPGIQHESGMPPDEHEPIADGKEAPAITAQAAAPKAEAPGQAVRRAYRDQLTAAGLSGEELRIATGIVYAAMRCQPNARRFQTYNRFKQRYGAQKGLEQYNIIKDAVKQISTDGPFPPSDADSLSEQPDPAQKTDTEAQPAAKPFPMAKEEAIETIRKICPGLTDKNYEKILRMIQHARKMQNSQQIYHKQLKESIGGPQAENIYKKTLYLLRI